MVILHFVHKLLIFPECDCLLYMLGRNHVTKKLSYNVTELLHVRTVCGTKCLFNPFSWVRTKVSTHLDDETYKKSFP